MIGAGINIHTAGTPDWGPLALNPLAWYNADQASSLLQGNGDPVTENNQFVATARDLSGNSNHLTAPNTNARVQFKDQSSQRWFDFNGVDDVLSVDLALSGTITFWVIMDISALSASRRVVSFGGGAGQDWNVAGYFSIEHRAAGGLDRGRSPDSLRQVISADADYLLVEVNNNGHQSFGPNGVNHTNAASSNLNSARLALGAAADNAPREYGDVRIKQFGLCDRALTATERSELTSYLEANLLTVSNNP